MSHAYYIVGVFIASILGWASWLVVINNVSPFISGSLALTLFYTSLFVALTGTFTGQVWLGVGRSMPSP